MLNYYSVTCMGKDFGGDRDGEDAPSLSVYEQRSADDKIAWSWEAP